MTLAEHVESYVAFKRATGVAFKEPARLLADFASFAEGRGDEVVRVESALAWASRPASPRRKRGLLQIVRGLAVHLHAEDERHEIPHRDALGIAASHRPPPRLLSLAEIRQVMGAAKDLGPSGTITPVTFHHIIGLLAATGMRRSEATGLQLQDDTPDGLRIRAAKTGRSRLVPLHETVRAALDRHLRVRRRCGGADEHFFVLANGRPLRPEYLSHTFLRLTRGLGLRGGPGKPGPRLHDLRHGFAVRALEEAVSGDRRQTDRHVLALSTYLGHANAEGTYWYLEATPLLLRRVSAAAETLYLERKGDD